MSSRELIGPDLNDFDRDEAMARLTHEMAAPPFHQVLRPEPVTIKPDGAVVIRLPFRPEFQRAPDSPFYHGGVLASLIDITAHAAIAVRVGRMVPTIDLRIDYLRAAPEGDLLAVGRALVVGRAIGRSDAEIFHKSGTLVAVGRGAFSTREVTPVTRNH
jgi:uncharacterized protein (TIGR00369 family)